MPQLTPSQETLRLLSQLIQNRCVNPPGSEMSSIQTIKMHLEESGAPCQVYESAPGRGNLVSRIKGDPGGPCIMFGPGHVDVAPVEHPERWSVEPFQAAIRDGYVWGRGALDMLFQVACQVQAFKELYAGGFEPRGDLVLLVVCDEENEGQFGTRWMLENHPGLVGADYAVTEAGGWHRAPGEVVFTNGEKGGGASPERSGFVDAMEEAVRMEAPGARLVPEHMPGKTDARYLRGCGAAVYGFGLYDPCTPLAARRVHGPDERVSLRTVELTRRVHLNLARVFLEG